MLQIKSDLKNKYIYMLKYQLFIMAIHEKWLICYC